MTDYGTPVRFGVFPEPLAADVDGVLAAVAQAEQIGLDLVGIQDHPYQRRHLDTFSLIAWLAARTTQVGFFTDVANLPLRPPAVLAKTAATLDVLSGGRFDLGLGAGGFWDAIVAMGGPRREPAEALGALGEAIDVIRLVWSGQRGLRYDGRHYHLAGMNPGPVPSRPVGIWLGVAGPRALALCGRVADGWVPSSAYVTPDRLPEMNARIDDAAVAADRQPGDVRRIYNVGGVVTDGEDRGFLHGPTARWIDDLTGLALEQGMDTFVLWPAAGDATGPAAAEARARQVMLFGREVAPAVRAAVAAARS